LLFRRDDRAIFGYRFAKNARQNIGQSELKAFRKLAEVMLAFDGKELQAAINNGTITEVMCHE
jgi:hypothetical protein